MQQFDCYLIGPDSRPIIWSRLPLAALCAAEALAKFVALRGCPFAACVAVPVGATATVPGG